MYIAAVATTHAGFYLVGEPAAVVPVRDSDGLRRALHHAMTKGNPLIPTPNRDAFLPSVLPKYTGDNSWSAFMRGASEWEVRDEDGSFVLTPRVTDPDGSQSWVPDPARKINFPPTARQDDVIERMAAIIQDAAKAGS